MKWNISRRPEALALLALTGLSCSAAPAAAGPIYYFVTGQSGAQTQIDVSHTTSWSFTATSAWTLGGADLTMKDGSGTTANVSLALYRGTDSTGTLLDSLTLNTAAFCTLHTGNCSSFNSTPLHFATTYTLTSGVAYYVALTSSASNVQSQAYFIKGQDTTTISDASGTALPGQTIGATPVPTPTPTPAPTPTPTPTSIPEPSSLAISATLLAGLMVHLRRKSAG